MHASDPAENHLEATDVAAYLDGALPPADQSRIELHLAHCDVCRAELRDVARLVSAQPHRRNWYLPIGVAVAAAATVLLIVRPAPDRTAAPTHREPVVTTTVAPVLVAPRGTVARPRRLIWTAVPHADQYRLTLFDDTGRAIWDTQASDTSVSLPASIRLQPGTAYFWKIDAQTGWSRWVSSSLIRFTVDSH